ncbi:CDP-glycerol glycerophosphotransferase family protein [Enterococcus dongliensis]|uniref:CDP-glycerol glycerophosphotransferase family protein n=1 Tax=Enterococcus dongliensis TaxID=2559925 RepID=UPI00288F7A91|nr:CDP-glycerol glycerophosphotransferase family protein [Enterococcus dongliensis]MDT2634763.1 CDP-glycerol glycerophosphotransferase family protein [Enterococcus dongliensis]
MFYILKFILNISTNFLVAILHLFIKKEKNLVLFGAWMGQSFSDNSRFLFQFLHYQSDRNVVWVSRNKQIIAQLNELGYTAVYMHSLRSYYYHLKAGTHIVCNVPFRTKDFKGDILGELSLFAKKIQLWHGIPLKGIGKLSTHNDNSITIKEVRRMSAVLKRTFFYRHLVNVSGGWDDYRILATSELIKEVFSEAFELGKNKIIVTSYPRNCDCIEYLPEEKGALRQIEKQKTILYVPTFREKNQLIQHPLENKKFREFLIDRNFLWVEKKHLADHENNNEEISSEVATLNLPPTFDLNTILPFVEILITDYSSISFDFIYFGKPIQYFVPDFNLYLKDERGFSLDFEEYTVGWQSNNLEQLMNNIDQQVKNPDDLSEKISLLKHKVYKNEKAFYAQIESELGL